jgi:hypothetical protein
MPYQSPNFANSMNLVPRGERAISQRVCGLACRVRVGTNVLGINIAAHGEVRSGVGRTRLLSPIGKSVRPALAHSTSLGGLKAATSASTGKAVREAVTILVHDNVILKSTIAVGGGVGPGEHAHLAGLAVSGGRKIGVVGPRSILNGEEDVVVLGTALAVIVALEVICGLGEA